METGGDEKIFCNISTRSLQDKAFFGEFLDFMEMNTDLAGRLIFEFSQETLDVCGPLELANLRRLTGLGFRFSMDQVTALDFDAASMRDRGFAFVKAPVGVLVDAADAGAIKARLARFGIDLIAEKIEDDRAVDAIVAAGVDFGQGYLLGEPRPAAAEPLALMDDREESTGAAA
jgi:cyclic-di-GMP phosphodiesterase TipF (flagellum assembly factor)